ncbi:MAG: hypothetical protein J7L47_02170 [Candidatus Odinarchaeota archaeon]|nr:hypothetical protein [Candidatus Odinarchaeota archaeon]
MTLMWAPRNTLSKISYTTMWYLAYTTALLDEKEKYAKRANGSNTSIKNIRNSSKVKKNSIYNKS